MALSQPPNPISKRPVIHANRFYAASGALDQALPAGFFDRFIPASLDVDGIADYQDQDFGYAPPGHRSGDGLIGDTVFIDRNDNGQFEPGEGLAGVAVDLFDSNGTLITSTVTNAMPGKMRRPFSVPT